MLCQLTNKYFQKISIFSSSKNPQYSIPLVSTHPRAPLLGFRPVAPCHSQSAPQNLSQFFIWFLFHIYFIFWFFHVHICHSLAAPQNSTNFLPTKNLPLTNLSRFPYLILKLEVSRLAQFSLGFEIWKQHFVEWLIYCEIEFKGTISNAVTDFWIEFSRSNS